MPRAGARAWTRRAVAAGLLGGLSGAWGAGAQTPAAFGDRLAAAAAAQVGVTLLYDPSYVKLAYPNGDVPVDRGVCTDVVIRAYRALGFDLQRLVHEDMRLNFKAYPKIWGLKKPDRHIDHRRVPNLETFFRRQGSGVKLSGAAMDVQVGDLISWRLTGSGLPHIGVAAAAKAPKTARPLITHNIGAGAQTEDVLTAWPIVGHFRWRPQ